MPPHLFSIADNAYQNMLQGEPVASLFVDEFRVMRFASLVKGLCQVNFCYGIILQGAFHWGTEIFSNPSHFRFLTFLTCLLKSSPSRQKTKLQNTGIARGAAADY